MVKTKVQFLQKPSCTTCRKAKVYLEKLGAEFELRNLDKEKLTEAKIQNLIGERDYKLFLNTRNELYRTRKMKTNPPTRADAVKLMAREPNLIRRPVVLRGAKIVLGYDEDAYKKLVE
ncbi:MAG: arsenate reductase family protein [Candidatus Acidiferrum sp.]